MARYEIRAKKKAAFQSLLNKIIMSEYEPGRILTEKILAQEFQITRTTLKDFLHRLELMKLVELIPRVGIKITNIDFNALLKDYEVKIYLEQMAATLAARHMNADQIKKIGDLINEMKTLYSDLPKLIQQDLLIHKMIYANCRNETLEYFLDVLQSRILRLIVKLFKATDLVMDQEQPGLKQLKEFHKMLVERDSEKAGLYFIEHSKATFDAIRQKLASESYF